MKEIKIKITFTEEVLGSSPANPEIYSDYIGSKSPDASTIEEEVEALGADAVAEKQMTIFPKTKEGAPFIYDYQIRGYFKEVCGILKQIEDTESSKITANKKLIDNYIFIAERQIVIDTHGEAVGVCQRPLRAQTAQGERVALAMSETIPAGSSIEFTVVMTADKSKASKSKKSADYEAALIEWLDYGKYKGFGQWRNSGKGRFVYEII